MPPMRCLPPVERSFGVRPAQAARWRPDSNIAGSISTANVNAIIGPTPGMVIKRWLSSLALCAALSLASTSLIQASISSICRPRRTNISMASGGMVAACSIAESKGTICPVPLAAMTAELSGVTTHRVDQSDTLADQCLTYLQDHTLGLLPDGFHRHVMHAWSPGRLADRFGVVAIVFAAFDIGFDVLRWDETYRVAERGEFAGPIVRAATGFQGNNGGWKLLEERRHLRATKVDAHERAFLLINACKVNTALDVSMPIRLYWVMDGSGFGYSQSQFWHSMPWGRPPQQF